MTEPADLLPRCSFPDPGTAVTCAVSGGADSLALLVLAVNAGCIVEAVHVDHGIREGSADEAVAVQAAAHRFGAAFRSVRISVETGPNLEARMRAARYGALPPDVLTGHTADDQAETLMLNLLRGSGSAGLAAMRHDRRPLLNLRRYETVALCASLGLRPLVDPTNLLPDYRRNRIRHELLPLANDVAQRDVVPLLNRTAALAREDDDLLEQLASALDPTDARQVSAAPRPLATRAIRRWLAPLLGGYPPDRDAVDRVLAVARGDAVACEVGGSVAIRRSGQRLAVRVSPDETAR